MKRLVLLLALLASPVTAWAACTGHDQQAMSCAQGQVWDPETDACVPIVTG
jgi:Chitin binding Peritrophin-A domain